ncbi:hypothetical protein ACFLZE_02260 [Thermodesulfobacteriota bacterium]
MSGEKMVLRFLANLKFSNFILSFSHSDYLVAVGGTEKVMHEEQAEYWKNEISYVQIHACLPREEEWQKGYINQLVCINVDSTPVGHFTMLQLGLIIEFLQKTGRINLIALQIHHLMYLSVSAIQFLLNTIQVPKICVFIHCYYTVCPLINLGEVFCEGICTGCEHEEIRSRHYSIIKKFFNRINAEFIAPSHVAAKIWCKSFPEHAERTRVIPHLVARNARVEVRTETCGKRLASANYRPRIAYVGYENFHKGLNTWWRLVANSDLKDKYQFFHLGAFSIRMPNVTYALVSFLETGLDSMKNALIEHKIDIAFLWSVCPETYSFTLHEAFAANCFVLTNGISGNIAAQIRETGRGIICRNEPDMLHLLNDRQRIKNLLQSHFTQHTPVDFFYNSQLIEESKHYLMPPKHLDASAADYSWINYSGNDLLRLIEIETLRADHIQKMGKRIQDLEHMLSIANENLEKHEQQNRGQNKSVYSESRAHRLLENTIRILGRHPVTERAVKSVWIFIWNVFSKIKDRVQRKP